MTELTRTMRTLVVIGVLAAFAQPACAMDNCDLPKPPPESAVTANHGAFYFVFPRSIPAGYTGCQTEWNEHGSIAWLLKFDKGALVVFEAHPETSSEEGFACRYRDGKAVDPDTTSCPEFDSVKNGVATLPRNLEPVVPSDRDPRK
jgi:hypothetical protein